MGDMMCEDGRSAIMEVGFDELREYSVKKKIEEEKAAKELQEMRENFSLSKLLDDQSIVDEDDKEIPLSHFKQEGMITGIYLPCAFVHSTFLILRSFERIARL